VTATMSPAVPFKTALRDTLCGSLRVEHVGASVRLGGWVHRRRDLGGLVFIDLRDRAGIVQVSFDPDFASPQALELARGLGTESVVLITGEVVARPAEMRNAELESGDVEVRGRRSETPLGAGKVVKSTMRKRSRVTEPPVLLTNLRRKLIVPKVEFCAGTEVKSRTRLGGFELGTVLSSAKFANEALR